MTTQNQQKSNAKKKKLEIMEKNLKNKKLGMSFILPESVTQPPQIISVYNQMNPTKCF